MQTSKHCILALSLCWVLAARLPYPPAVPPWLPVNRTCLRRVIPLEQAGVGRPIHCAFPSLRTQPLQPQTVSIQNLCLSTLRSD